MVKHQCHARGIVIPLDAPVGMPSCVPHLAVPAARWYTWSLPLHLGASARQLASHSGPGFLLQAAGRGARAYHSTCTGRRTCKGHWW